MSVKLVNEAQALLSMRESDFDTYSAYGEAVDNSIQAGAENIYLRFETEKIRGNYEAITRLSFIDDGDGMPKEIIHRCLQLGYSSRFNDRTGIGRFGVGMTLGAIHECQKIDVFSRQSKNENWLSTCVDLRSIEEATADEDAEIDIKIPTEKEFPEWVIDLQPKGKGTAVIWSSYDRQSENASKVIENTKIWLGRTFRHFIWNDNVSIFVNGEKVFAIDPLYVTTKDTQFPSDPSAELAVPIEIEWPVPEDVASFEGEKDKIIIKLSLLPIEFRPNQGAGNSEETRKRHIHENQGISITRLGREVFYGAIPYWPGTQTWFAEIDRWWGCEVDFSPKLDRVFTVKNIKRGAVPNKELKEAIYDRIKPTVDHYLERVRDDFKQSIETKRKEEAKKGEHKTGHEKAENIAKKTTSDKTSKKVDDKKKAEDELIDRLKRERTAEEDEAVRVKWRNQPFTIEEDLWKGADFFELKPLGGNDVILYNNGHPFMAHMKSLVDDLISQEDSHSRELGKQLKCLIDLLLIAYTKAESKFSEDEHEEFFELIRLNWGQYLSSYLKNIKEKE